MVVMHPVIMIHVCRKGVFCHFVAVVSFIQRIALPRTYRARKPLLSSHTNQTKTKEIKRPRCVPIRIAPTNTRNNRKDSEQFIATNSPPKDRKYVGHAAG